MNFRTKKILTNTSNLPNNINLIDIEILKPEKGNSFNTFTISGLGDYLDRIKLDQKVDKKVDYIIIRGYLDRGLDISQIMANISENDLNKILDDFETNSWRDVLDKDGYKLPKALNVLKDMLKGMFRLLGIINELQDMSVKFIGICNNAIAGGAAIMCACDKVLSSGNVYTLPEAFFDIPVGDLAHFMIKKGINNDIIKGYVLGAVFNSDEALKYNIIDKVIDKVIENVNQLDISNIIDEIINISDDIPNSRNTSDIADKINYSLINQNIIDYSVNSIRLYEQVSNKDNNQCFSDIWEESINNIISKTSEKSIIKLLHYIWLDNRFDQLRP